MVSERDLSLLELEELKQQVQEFQEGENGSAQMMQQLSVLLGNHKVALGEEAPATIEGSALVDVVETELKCLQDALAIQQAGHDSSGVVGGGEHGVKLEDGFCASAAKSDAGSGARSEVELVECGESDIGETLVAAQLQQEGATDWLTQQLGGVLDAHAVKLQDGFESLAAASHARSGSELTERVDSDLEQLLVAAHQLTSDLADEKSKVAELKAAQSSNGQFESEIKKVLDLHIDNLEGSLMWLADRSKERYVQCLGVSRCIWCVQCSGVSGVSSVSVCLVVSGCLVVSSSL